MSSAAAFFRLEGVLLGRPAWAAAAWLAANAQEVGERVARIGNVALSLPLRAGPFSDGTLATRVEWMGLRGMSDDRLAVLGEDYARDTLVASLREPGVGLLEAARRRGLRPVLLGTGVEDVLRPVAEHLGVEDLLCNRLERRDGKATGRLEDPVLAGARFVDAVRRFAAERDVDLARSAAYGSAGDDDLLLAAVAQPCAVRPDRRLRRIARDLGWPVAEA